MAVYRLDDDSFAFPPAEEAEGRCGTKTAMMLANQLEGALDEMIAA